MNPRHALTARLATLHSWRHGVSTQIARVADFVREHGYYNAELERSFESMTTRASRESVVVILVAEAGRGKSELINAMFFTDLGRRLLPSGVLRATRCITEVRFDRTRKTGVSLLPIESREAPRRFRDLYDDESEWRTILFDADNAESLDRALGALAETRRVGMSDAVSWGVHGDALSNLSRDGGWVDVPKWRYAVINMPHPLLDAGLVVIDTPGLGALTAEPEFTREDLPNADAVLIVVDASEGVTKPDLSIWKDQLGASRNMRERSRDESRQARLVVMNKIDRTYVADPLDAKEADRRWLKDLDKRVQDVADLMRIEPIHVFPVSASMAIEGAFTQNRDLQLRSRLYRLERSLAQALPEDRQQQTGKEILNELSEVLESVQADLDQRRFTALEGLRALGDIRKKNLAMIETLTRETGDRHRDLATAMQELRTIKPIHAKLAAELSSLTDPGHAKAQASVTLRALGEARMTSKGDEVLTRYFENARIDLLAINAKINEIRDVFGNLGERHFRVLGIGHFEVHPFATSRFEAEISRSEEVARAALASASSSMLFRARAVADAFDEHVGSRIVHMLEIAHRESTSWMRGVFLSIERPLEELSRRTSERAGKIEKVQAAELDLAEKIADVQGTLDIIKSKHSALGLVREGLERYARPPADQDT
jgi:predicted GTPase